MKNKLEKSKEIDFKYDYVLEDIQFDVDYFLPYDKLIFKKKKMELSIECYYF